MLLFAILSLGRAEPSVSLGAHPVVANAGSLSASATASVFSTPSDQLLLLTDIILS